MISLKFPHRHNLDGTHDSICTGCLATIATVRSESDLALYESCHVCRPMDLCRMTEDHTRDAHPQNLSASPSARAHRA